MKDFTISKLAVFSMIALTSLFQAQASHFVEYQPFVKSTSLSTDNKENEPQDYAFEKQPVTDGSYKTSLLGRLPNESFCYLVDKLDQDSLKNLKETCKDTSEQTSDPYILKRRKTEFVIKNKKDLAAFAAMHQSNELLSDPEHLNIPVKIKDKTLTDDYLIHLVGTTIVDLTGCNQITDAGLVHLTKATSVNLARCTLITDAGLACLINAITVDLDCCDLITNAGLAHLKNATTVELSDCYNITDEGLVYLKNATTVCLAWCNLITDAGLAYLTNATTIILIGCDNITDAGLAHLKNATYVDLYDCEKITDAARQALRDRGVRGA